MRLRGAVPWGRARFSLFWHRHLGISAVRWNMYGGSLVGLRGGLGSVGSSSDRISGPARAIATTRLDR